jgi:virginiamycin A acetyltransferase
MRMLSEILFKMYALKSGRLRKIILSLVTKIEKGQMYSATLRKIFSKYHNIEIGMYSYGGCFEPGAIAQFTIIGRYCSFASGVRVFNGDHPLQFKSMHPFFYNPALGYVKNELISRNRITIGNDVWLGHNAIILSNVRSIGDGAVIGAGTVVTKDVPDFAVVVGNPGKVIKYRFSEQTIQKLKKERWWDKDIDELKAKLDSFTQDCEKILQADEFGAGGEKVNGPQE